MLTIMLLLALAAFVATTAHAISGDRTPLWIAVFMLCFIELLRALPVGR